MLGGGYVCLELAQAYRRFGSRVTIIEFGPQLAGLEDADVADEVQQILTREGVDVLVSAETLELQGRSGGEVKLRTPAGEQTIAGSEILVTTGRTPNTAGSRGIEVRVARLPTSDILRTRTIDVRQGLMKALVGARDDNVLGFAMIGAEAGEVMAVVQMAMLGGMPYTGLRDAIIAHPTLAEGLGLLFSNVPPRAAS